MDPEGSENDAWLKFEWRSAARPENDVCLESVV
jgi:hypothetical protein